MTEPKKTKSGTSCNRFSCDRCGRTIENRNSAWGNCCECWQTICEDCNRHWIDLDEGQVGHYVCAECYIRILQAPNHPMYKEALRLKERARTITQAQHDEIDPDLIYCARCGKQIKDINSGWGVCPACGDGEGTTLCEQCAGGWTEYAGDNDKHSYCVCNQCSTEIKQGKKKTPPDE